MVLSFTSKIPNGNIERNFVERLKNEQVSCKIRENDLPGQKEGAETADEAFAGNYRSLILCQEKVQI